jgi:predicted lipoprotein with Yx(FWY)xxD motif
MTVSGSRGTTYAIAAAAVAVLAAGCGSSSSGSQTVSPASGGGSQAAASTTTTQSTSIGTVLADSKGRTVYELVGDTAANSKCSSACQAIWPPVMSGGKIMVVHGHPAFTFTGDSAAGQTHGEGSKDTWGLWLALTPSGSPIAAGAAPAAAQSSAPTSTSSSSSGGSTGGGYGY